MLVSPHCHPESFLTGSTLKSLIDKHKELKRSYFTYTDNGHLASTMKAYGLAKKAGLKFIAGMEFYFKDSSCDIVSKTSANRCKYYTASIYCEDQEAYQELCKVVSSTDLKTTHIREEPIQLWTWKELEHLSQFKTHIVLSGTHCIVAKNLLAGHPEVGMHVFDKILSLYPNRTSVALLASAWTKKYAEVVEVFYKDGTTGSFLSTDYIGADKARKMKAADLVTNIRRNAKVLYKLDGSIVQNINKEFDKVISHKGYLPYPEDITLKTNKFLKALANRRNVPILVTDYAYYSNKEDKIVQTMRLENETKLYANLHVKSQEEVLDYLTNVMLITQEDSLKIIDNNSKWANQFDSFSLKYEMKLVGTQDDPSKMAMAFIKEKGRMQWDNPIYVERLKEELLVIAKNPVKNLLPYFFPIIDANKKCTENNVLTGVARGSAGGSLLCYLMGVTNLNPLKYDLSFSRFLSLDRIKNGDFPDVDCDFSDRTVLFGEDGQSGYLKEKYGDGVAQIGTKTTIRLKSAIKDANRYFEGEVHPSIDLLTKGLPVPPQGVSDESFLFGYEDDEGSHISGLFEQSEELQKYAEKRPREWDMVQKALGIIRSNSIHPCATVLSDIPIKSMVPLRDGFVTQYEAKEVESVGLLKYDFLKVDQLKDIEVCLKLINKKNKEDQEIGYFTHNGTKTHIWDLPEVLEVFKSIWGGDTATIFQLHTQTMVPYVKDILPQSVDDISTILALVRPGPLDYIFEETGRNAAEEYIARRNGTSECDIPELFNLIPETYGSIVFQEQQLKIAKELGGMPSDQAEALRRLFAKKKKDEALKMKPIFMESAVKKIGQEMAEKIWAMMETFARYSFNKSHSTAYGIISYACMFLKYNYPLEWWAAVLTNADEKEITGKFWPYVKDIVKPPDINLSGDTMVVDYQNRTLRAKLGVMRGIGEASIDPIVKGRPYTDIQDFVNKEVAGDSLSYKLIHVGVLDSLFPSGLTLVQKLQIYEDAKETKIFVDRSETAKKERRKIRALQPKTGVVDPEYSTLYQFPLKDAAMKKAVLPSIPVDFYKLGSLFSKVKANYEDRPTVTSSRGHRTPLFSPQEFKRINNMEGDQVHKDFYFAVTCFILDAKEFSFSKNTKRALKMNIDAGEGYSCETVLWPDYESGELLYPVDLKKGAIATIFFRKRANKKDVSVMSVTLEN